MNTNRPRYNQLLNELKSQLPTSCPTKGSEFEIHLKNEYSSKLKKQALHILGYTTKKKKIGTDFIVIKL